MLKETLFCTSCGEEKPLDEFGFRNKKKGIRHMRCKACIRAYTRQHYQDNKRYYKKKARRINDVQREVTKRYMVTYLLEHPCVDCGETDPLVLDFDHVRGKKRMAVSEMVAQGYSISTIKKEIAKCEVRCANCHRIKTAKEGGWYIVDLYEEYLKNKA